MKPAPTTSPAVDINGYALRHIRILTGVSPLKLAGQIGVDRSYIARIETGHNRRVSPEVYKALLDALGIKDRRTLLAAPHAAESAA